MSAWYGTGGNNTVTVDGVTLEFATPEKAAQVRHELDKAEQYASDAERRLAAVRSERQSLQRQQEQFNNQVRVLLHARQRAESLIGDSFSETTDPARIRTQVMKRLNPATQWDQQTATYTEVAFDMATPDKTPIQDAYERSQHRKMYGQPSAQQPSQGSTGDSVPSTGDPIQDGYNRMMARKSAQTPTNGTADGDYDTRGTENSSPASGADSGGSGNAIEDAYERAMERKRNAASESK